MCSIHIQFGLEFGFRSRRIDILAIPARQDVVWMCTSFYASELTFEASDCRLLISTGYSSWFFFPL